MQCFCTKWLSLHLFPISNAMFGNLILTSLSELAILSGIDANRISALNRNESNIIRGHFEVDDVFFMCLMSAWSELDNRQLQSKKKSLSRCSRKLDLSSLVLWSRPTHHNNIYKYFSSCFNFQFTINNLHPEHLLCRVTQ